MNKELKLAPINPFTPRQSDVIKAILEGETSHERIAQKLKMSINTVSNHIKGGDPSILIYIEYADKRELGIYGIVEKLTGKRPHYKNSLIAKLLDDVVFLR